MDLSKKCMIMPGFLPYVVHDKDGTWGMEKLGLTEDAPEWAKEEYEKWWTENERLKKQLIKV